MAKLSGRSLMMAVQAVRDQIARLDRLLTSETLSDREALTELLMSYESAAEELRDAYMTETKGGRVNLPAYDELIKQATLLP
jgi:hypothetical protein